MPPATKEPQGTSAEVSLPDQPGDKAHTDRSNEDESPATEERRRPVCHVLMVRAFWSRLEARL